MDVIRADVLGFCGGVRRAVAMLEDAATQFGVVYTLHEIVHNKHVMERLREKGVVLVNSLSEIPDDATVALTAHGAPLRLIAGIRARQLTLVDATCPIVADAQRVVAENAKSKRFTIIFGDSQHLEVRSLLSQASVGAVAAESMDGLIIPSEGRLGLVAQTTKSPTALQAFANDLRAQLGAKADLIVQDTTCAEPVSRYHAARELAAAVDAIVVVGSPTSANTRNLYAVCCESGKTTFFPESADEIDKSSYAAFSRIGLTAGASTPDWVIDAVEQRLRQL
jgi:(E)-4-hydroxy-3-methyl-but-2-enyl pyrophosphate reductase